MFEMFSKLGIKMKTCFVSRKFARRFKFINVGFKIMNEDKK